MKYIIKSLVNITGQIVFSTKSGTQFSHSLVCATETKLATAYRRQAPSLGCEGKATNCTSCISLEIQSLVYYVTLQQLEIVTPEKRFSSVRCLLILSLHK